jgi:hypothetical protein
LPLKEGSCTLKPESVLPYGSTENELLRIFMMHFIVFPVRIHTFKYLKYFNIKLNFIYASLILRVMVKRFCWLVLKIY